MGGHLHQFEQRLRAQGLRVTSERRAILDYALRHSDHFDAEELLGALRDEGVPVSRATIYRTLTCLVKAGLLRRHPLTDRRAFYEPDFGGTHHEHLVCVRCGKILEFVEDEIERLQEGVCERHAFRPLRHTLQIYGVCESCQRADPANEGRSDGDASRKVGTP